MVSYKALNTIPKYTAPNARHRVGDGDGLQA